MAGCFGSSKYDRYLENLSIQDEEIKLFHFYELEFKNYTLTFDLHLDEDGDIEYIDIKDGLYYYEDGFVRDFNSKEKEDLADKLKNDVEFFNFIVGKL